MPKRLLLFALVIAAPLLRAQTGAFNGLCFSGGRSALTQGLSSTNKLDGVIPSCTVAVYLTGTTNLATIFRDGISTPLPNPFTANNSLPATAAPGQWLFYASTGVGYDVVMSGGIPPLTYLLPVTLTDVQVGGGGGGSGVTSFSAGNLSPLFTTNVTNPGTTPNLAFNLSNATANSIFGNFNVSSGSPFFANYTCTGLLTCGFNSGSNTLNFNVPASAALSITATAPIRVNAGTGPVSSGTANIDCPTCGSALIQPVVTPPVTGQYVVIRPTTYAQTRLVGGASQAGIANGTVAGAALFTGDLCALDNEVQVQFGGFALPAGITAGQVTGIYLFSTNGTATVGTGRVCFGTPAPNIPAAVSIAAGSYNVTTTPLSPSAQQTVHTTLVGTDIPGVLVTADSVISTQTDLYTFFTISDVGLIVYYTGSPVVQPSGFYIAPYLSWNPATNTLGTDPNFPKTLFEYKVATLPGPQAFPQSIQWVSDGVNATDCTVGGGNNVVACVPVLSGTNYIWQAWGSGGGGSGTVTSVGTDATLTGGPITTVGTLGINLGNANTWTAVQTFNLGLTIASGHSLTNTGVSDGCGTWTSGVLGSTGSACGSGGGGGVTGSGTTGYLPKWTGSTALGNSAIDDGITTASTVTSTEPIAIAAASLATQQTFTYNAGHAPSGSAGSAVVAPDTSGNFDVSENNGSFARVCTATNGICGSSTSPGIFPIDSYGGVGDGNLSANTGTDNTSAFASALAAAVSNGGGTITFDCGKQYRFLTTGPTITTSSISLQGSCPGAAAATYSSLAGAATTIFTSSASATVVDFHGTSTTATITNNSIQNISISRAVPPGSGAIGLNVHFTTGFTSNQVTINDSATGIDGLYDPSFTGSGFLNTNVLWGWSGVAQGTGPYICFNANGGSTGYSSMILSNVGCNKNPATITSTTTYGVKGFGFVTDLNVYYLGTAFVDYPIYLSGTGGQDVHFISPTADNIGLTNYIAITGNSITISDWWATVSTSTVTSAWELNGATGVSLIDGQCYISENIPCIYEHSSSSQNIFNNNRFFLGQTGSALGQGILINNSSATVVGNNFDGGQQSGYSLPWLSFVGANYSTVQGNSFSRGTGVAIKADASSTYNCCINPPPATNIAVTLTISDLGSNNELTSGVAWGAITGTLSSQTDLNTALGLKAPLASPTFTGTVTIPTGASIAGFAPLASPTLTGVPAAPTATGGTNTTQLATTAFVQAAIAAAGTGAGIVTYSGPSLTFSGTQYFPIGGGGLASSTETNVDIDSPAAVTVQNMTVQMSAAPGVGNSVVYTWRKNASSQTLTCTISGASATSCSDTTHSFTTASLDLLDIQAVTTGTIVGTPTVIMAAQVGISAATSTAFSAISGGTNTGNTLTVGNSSSVTPSGTGVVNANQVNGAIVPASQTSLATNSSGQIIAGSSAYPIPTTVNQTVGASDLEVLGCITSSYKRYKIYYSNLIQSAASTILIMQVSHDNGSTWDTTTGHYQYGRYFTQMTTSTGNGFSSNQSDTGFSLTGSSGDSFGANSQYNGEITFYDPLSTTVPKNLTVNAIADGLPSPFDLGMGWQYTQTATSVNAIRFIPKSGSGTVTGNVTCQPLPQ